MNSEKIAYWVALSVFAVGISHEYQEGKFPTVHRSMAKAEATLCRLATRAQETIVLAKFIVAPPAARAGRDVFAVTGDLGAEQLQMLQDQAQDQAELVREQVQAQAELLRAQADLRQVEQTRHFTESQFRFSPVADRHFTLICPKTGARVAVNVNPPDVEVTDNF